MDKNEQLLLSWFFIYIILLSRVKPVYNGHPWDLKKLAVSKRCCLKLRFRLVFDESNPPLLKGGRYSKVVVKSSLTVYPQVIDQAPSTEYDYVTHWNFHFYMR